jgi:hypothetical protein
VPSSNSKQGGRFVEPYRLTVEQRGLVLRELEDIDIGDGESRDLFVAALEYDLAGWRDLIGAQSTRVAEARGASAGEPGETLSELAAGARLLEKQLAVLDGMSIQRLLTQLEEADPFRRHYSEGYLEALRAELTSLVEAAETLAGPLATDTIPEEVIGDDARRFVRQIADAFRDCFEQQPSAEDAAPFVLTIATIAATTGIRVPTDHRRLARILAGAP